jgi:hypothetical protein
MSAFRAKADMLGDPLEKYVHALQKKAAVTWLRL